MAEQFSVSYLLTLVDKLSTPLIKVGSAFDELNRKFSSAGKLSADLGKKMSAFATVPIMGWAAYAAHEADKINIAFREMGHSLEDLPHEQLTQLKKDLLDMSTVMPRSADELAEYAEMAGRLNELSDVKGFVQFITAFTSQNKDMRSREGIASFMELMQVLQTGQSDYEHMGDVITALGERMNATSGAIVQGALDLAHLRVAGKMTREELLALSAWGESTGASGLAMKQFTKTMNEAALGMKMVDMAILSKVSGYGTDTGKFQREFENHPVVVIQKFLKGMAGMKEEGHVYELLRILQEIGLSGNRVQSTVLKGFATSEQLARSYRIATDSAKTQGKMMDEYRGSLKDFDNQMKMLGNTVDAFAKQFGDDIKPVWIWFIDLLKSLINVFKSLPAWTRGVVEGLLLLTATLGPLLIALAVLKGAFAILGPIIGAIGVGLGMISAPVVAATAAIIALGVAIYELSKHWQTLTTTGFVDTFKDFGKWLGYLVMGGSLNPNNPLNPDQVWGTWNPTTQTYEYAPNVTMGAATSGAGGVLGTPRAEGHIKIELDSGLKIGGIKNGPNMRVDVHSPGYMGVAFGQGQ